MSKQKNFPKPSKELRRLNRNRRNLIKLNRKATLRLCNYAPENRPNDPCMNCIESKCLVPNGIPKQSDFNRCFHPRTHEEEVEGRRKKERIRESEEYEKKHKGKTGIQIINEYLNKALNG